MGINDSCETGPVLQGIRGLDVVRLGGSIVAAAYTALGEVWSVVITRSQVVGGEDHLRDC